jgi:hypothetical protein
MATRLTVRPLAGSGGDYCPDAGDDLDLLVAADLRGLHLAYVEPAEVARLIADDDGDLGEACGRAGALAATAAELRESPALEPPLTGSTSASSGDRGEPATPWRSGARGRAPLKEIAQRLDTPVLVPRADSARPSPSPNGLCARRRSAVRS